MSPIAAGRRLIALLGATATLAVGLVAVAAGPASADRGGVEEVLSLNDESGLGLVSADLSTLVVNDWERGGISVIDLDTSERTDVSLEGVPFYFFPLGLTGDGAKLLVNGPWEGVEAGDVDGRLNDGFLYDISAGELELVTPGPGDVVNDVWSMSADGETFVLASTGVFDSLPTSFSLIRAGVQTPLDLPTSSPEDSGGPVTLSADGSALAFSRQRGGSTILYRLDLTTDDIVARGGLSGGYGVRMSDDGSVLAWPEEGQGLEFGLNSTTVRVWDTDADTVESFDVEGYMHGPLLVSGDGLTISGISHAYGEAEFQSRTWLWQYDVGTGELETLVSSLSADGGTSAMAVNNDGSEIIFSAYGPLGATDLIPSFDEGYQNTVYRWSADGTPSPTAPGAHTGSPALADQLVRLYQAYFGRAPDVDGLEFWLQERAGGASLASVSSAFAGAPEFVDTYGALDDAAFVTLVYQNVLDRAPDAGGLAFWSAQLAAGVSRGQVMIGFSESPEFVDATGTSDPMSANEGAIRRMYLGFFGREASQAEVNGWVDQLDAGVTLDAVAQVFAQTEEYQEIYGGADMYAIFEFTIRRVLGRHANDSDYNRWLGPISNGQLTIPEFLLQVSMEPEHVLATGTTPVGG